MKKRIAALLLALAMALAVFPAAAAEPLQVSGLGQGQTGFLAGYNDSGRMLGLRMLTADGEAPAIPGATSLKLIRTDSSCAPQGQALSLSQGQGTVRRVDGQVCICYDGPEGLTVSQPVSEKITGQVSVFTTGGRLNIKGRYYQATELSVEGCALPISEEAFANWAFEGGSFSTTYDFYLDQSGSICWIDQREDGSHQLCVVLSAEHDASGLQVEILPAVGAVKTISVNQLNGKVVIYGNGGIDGSYGGGGSAGATAAAADVIVSGIAVQLLNQNAKRAFYTYYTLADGGYGLVLADENAPAETGFTWGKSYVIPDGSPIQANADFTWGTIPCRADGQTRFLIAVGNRGHKEYRSFVGIQFLPNTQASGCALAGPDGVAEYVYLDTPYFAVDAPEGYIMVSNHFVLLDPDLLDENVCQIRIVDADGYLSSLRVPYDIARAVANDSMRLDHSFADNAYVGKFFRITALDQNGVVLGLEPVETLVDVLNMGRGIVSLANGVAYDYDSDTKFIYVDTGWTDDLNDPTNKIGVREPGKDNWAMFNAGTFDPEHFFDAADVDDTGAYSDSVDEQNPYDVTYISVKAAVIPYADDPTLAKQVYVVRELW